MTEVAAEIPNQRLDEAATDQPGWVEGQVEGAVERVSAATGRLVDRVRNAAETATERGRTIIADDVVEKISGIAAREVAGVHDLGGDVARLFASMKEKVGLGDANDDAERGVSVRLDGENATVDITIVIKFGYVVNEVTEQVRAKVIAAVEHMLGLAVTEVNILVDDVHLAEGQR